MGPFSLLCVRRKSFVESQQHARGMVAGAVRTGVVGHGTRGVAIAMIADTINI